MTPDEERGFARPAVDARDSITGINDVFIAEEPSKEEQECEGDKKEKSEEEKGKVWGFHGGAWLAVGEGGVLDLTFQACGSFRMSSEKYFLLSFLTYWCYQCYYFLDGSFMVLFSMRPFNFWMA